jgi:hypothetical protein
VQIDGVEREVRERGLHAVKVDQIVALDTAGGAVATAENVKFTGLTQTLGQL